MTLPLLSGFVLSANQRDTDNGIELHYWLVTDHGYRQIVIEEQENVFFVLEEDEAEIRIILRTLGLWRLEKLNLFDLNHKPVMGLYCKSLSTTRKIISKLHTSKVVMMEEDIRPCERYLMERFIKGGVRSTTKNAIRLLKHDYQPHFKILSLDIETNMHTGSILCIGIVDGLGQQEVIMLGEGTDTQTIRFAKTEAILLKKFVELIHCYDPDIIIGWNVIGFDFSVIQERAELFQVELSIGRDSSTAYIHRSAQGKAYIRMTGRIVLDGIDVLKGATYQFNSYALDNVARQLLKKGKLVENVAHRADEIIQMFSEDKVALARYNLMDCELVLEIFRHAKLIEYLIERTRLTGLALDKVGGWSTAFDNLYLPKLHRKGFVAPEYASGVSNMASPGGYVMNSIPGLYRHVLVLDFKSLYPSIIRTFKIDPLGLAKSKILNNEELLVPGFNGAEFAKQDNILPEIINELWNARDKAKRANNPEMSQAIKILMSSMYGVLGSNACRFFDHRLSGSITLRGHEILTRTAQRIEKEYSYKVIYGDTDSVFVWLGNECSDHDAHRIGHELAKALTCWWRESLKTAYVIESHLELEYETHYRHFLMPTMRDSDEGTKKRYAGLQHFEDGQTSIVFKGMENVRSDWTDLAKEMQQHVFSCAFNELPYEQYIIDTVRQVREGMLDEKLMYHRKLRQPVENYQKNRPPHAQAALKLKQYYLEQNLKETVNRGQIIKYYMTVNGPEPVECWESVLDYDHYIDKQLKPALDVLLSVKGESFDTLVGLQIGLF